MRKLALLLVALAFALQAHANPALHGTWSVAVNNQPLVLVFNPDGTGSINGQGMKWQTLMKLLVVQPNGGQVISYGFDVKDGKLSVSGGDINGILTLTPGTAAADAARANAAKQPPAASAGQAST